MVLLYDGDCALCTRAVSRLRRWTAPGAVEFVSFRSSGVLDRFPRVSAAACEQAMQLILPDGRVISGAEGGFRILATRWWLRPLLWVYLVPGVRQTIDAAYRVIARNRLRFGRAGACDHGACARDR